MRLVSDIQAFARPPRLGASFILATLFAAIWPAFAHAQTPAVSAAANINSGDTAWLLTSTALVFLMTIPGIALFYAGMVRRRNIIDTAAQSFVICCVVSLTWCALGYSLAFDVSSDSRLTPWVGGLGRLFLRGVGLDHQAVPSAPSVPESSFLTFQMSFAVIAAAIIAGAVVERIRFSALLLFVALWSVLDYAPLAHWVWGGGFLAGRAAPVLDFAGGAVVHINAGVAGLVCALVVGPRQGVGQENMAPNNVLFTMIGAGLLWIGWFGFNGGSALAADGLAAQAMCNTQLAASAAALAWMSIEWTHRGRPGLLGLASGAVAGLVAITPAAGFVDALSALAIGVVTAPICYVAITFAKARLSYDDSLDAFGVHGVGGIVGAILTGILADSRINPSALHHSVVSQLVGIAVTCAWSALTTYLILMLCKVVTGLRVSPEAEEQGMDISLHGETLHETPASQSRYASQAMH